MAYIFDGLKKERVKPILDLCISRFDALSKLQGELDRAKAILMKRKGLTEEEAYVLLRSTVMREKKKIGERADRRQLNVILQTRDGRLKISPDGTMRECNRHLLVGREGTARPDPVQAAWLYWRVPQGIRHPAPDNLTRSQTWPEAKAQNRAAFLQRLIFRLLPEIRYALPNRKL